ncbi:hypothetical protein M011DRAFT_523383 [Sporormia fimetaria CBS 119925]|uniref:F-box domain-containing protein n=1 Tax=Sporormia fimetaria CBS 119925 TaxID=1340428 RepID=A0A6A6VLA1_9PLEO|nr:hypothetical protein M011DRAFT_523383 [Sporormia fimetaria CBS 119925]
MIMPSESDRQPDKMVVYSKLELLATELKQDITGYLELQDLLSFRAASHTCDRGVQKEFAEKMAGQLRSLRVLQTDDGLRLLLGLCQMDECLERIYRVDIVTMRQLDSPALYGANLMQFEASDACIELWTNILSRLKESRRFTQFRIGLDFGGKVKLIDNVLGARRLLDLRAIPLREVLDFHPLTWRHLSTALSAFMTAVTKTELKLAQIGIHMSDVSLGRPDPREYPHLMLPECTG